jgi:hypothetical protein
MGDLDESTARLGFATRLDQSLVPCNLSGDILIDQKG